MFIIICNYFVMRVFLLFDHTSDNMHKTLHLLIQTFFMPWKSKHTNLVLGVLQTGFASYQ